MAIDQVPGLSSQYFQGRYCASALERHKTLNKQTIIKRFKAIYGLG